MRKGTLLKPQWENIPQELKSLDRWIVWRASRGKKTPFSCSSPSMPINATDPAQGATFEEAKTVYENGSFDGVGFILAGEGIVAADLDDCVDAGAVSPGAVCLLEELGAAYVEVSPSGTGLHAFGKSVLDADGRQLEIMGVKLELYGKKRYMTVTGHVLPHWHAQTLPVLHGYDKLATGASRSASPAGRHAGMGSEELMHRPPETCTIRVAGLVLDLPPKCIPHRVGVRHRCIFELARFLKGKLPAPTEDQCYAAVEQWHTQVVHVIGTKELETSWAEFLRAWGSVEAAHGAVLSEILRGPLPPLLPWMEDQRFDAPGEKLLRLCLALAEHHKPDPFFLACRSVAEELGRHHATVAAMLNAFVVCGYLELVHRGSRNRASEYRIGTGRRDAIRGQDTE